MVVNPGQLIDIAVSLETLKPVGNCLTFLSEFSYACASAPIYIILYTFSLCFCTIFRFGRLEQPPTEHPLRLALAPDLPLVNRDAMLIERVLVNLLENAVKYTPATTTSTDLS